MPSKIHALDENAIRQIAAGEVVERPASIVKELIENSIDAQSRHMTLEIAEGGKKMIRVSDDGEGMNSHDASLAFERHTTSKIRSVGDLENLFTFGFRGEALPSIASVSKTRCVTRSSDEPHGISLSFEGGKLISKKECGRDKGTTIEIREIFFNTPARFKFMKSETSEKNKIYRTFEEIAVIHPDLSFELRNESGKNLKCPVRSQALQRLADLWGEPFNPETMIPLEFKHPLINIGGWVSNPQSHKPTKNYQIFYVNHRPILSRFITHALYESYRDCLPAGRHPAAVISLTLDPSQVDVNVHPSKREVRFRNESQIYNALTNEIRLKRSQLSPVPKIFSIPESPVGNDMTPNSTLNRQTPAFSSNIREPASSYDLAHQTSFLVQTVEKPPNRSETFPTTSKPGQPQASPALFVPQTRVLSVFNSLYVLAERGNDLLIIDQHAAAERILYERFKAAYQSKGPVPTQTLLIPLVWNGSLAQTELIKAHRLSFQKLGFWLEDFGERTFRISEAPSWVPETELKSVLDEAIASIENQPSLAIEEKIMHSACRAAIKANDRLQNRELTELLEQLSRCDNAHTCPHGRPITLTIPRTDLDKKFGRT